MSIMIVTKRRISEQTLTWASIATSTQADPDKVNDAVPVINLTNAEFICVQIDRSATALASADTGLYVYSSPDGVTYDTTPFASYATIASAEVVSFTMHPGPKYLKMQMKNNSTTIQAAAIVTIQTSG